MAAKKKHLSKIIPSGYWSDELRNGVYRLHPNESVTIEGEEYVNRGKETIRLHAGKAIPNSLM